MAASCKRVALPERAAVAASSPDGSLLAICGHSGNLFLWDTTTGAFLRLLNLEQRVHSLRFLPNFLIASGRDVVFVFSISDIASIDDSVHKPVEPMILFKEHRAQITCWDAHTVGLEGWVLSGDREGHIYVWDIRTGDVLSHIVGSSMPSCVAASPCIPIQAAVGFQNGEVRLLDVAAATEAYSGTEYLEPLPASEFPVTMHLGTEVRSCFYSFSGDHIITICGKTVVVWDLQTRQTEQTFDFEEEVIWGASLVAFQSAEELTTCMRASQKVAIAAPLKFLDTLPSSLRRALDAPVLVQHNLETLLRETEVACHATTEPVAAEALRTFVDSIQLAELQAEDARRIAAAKDDSAALQSLIERLLTAAQQAAHQPEPVAPPLTAKHQLLWRLAKTVAGGEPAEEPAVDPMVMTGRPSAYSEPLASWHHSRANHSQQRMKPRLVTYVPEEVLAEETVPGGTGSELASSASEGTGFGNEGATAITEAEPVMESKVTPRSAGDKDELPVISPPARGRKRRRLVPLDLSPHDSFRRGKRRRKIMQAYNFSRALEKLLASLASSDVATDDLGSSTDFQPQQPGAETKRSDVGRTQEEKDDAENRAESVDLPSSLLISRREVKDLFTKEPLLSTNEEPSTSCCAFSPASPMSAPLPSAETIALGSVASPTVSEPLQEEAILHERIQQSVLATKQAYNLPLKQLPRIFPLKSIVRKRRAYNMAKGRTRPLTTAELGFLLHAPHFH
eukprot:Protomagalhaensia_sp_Gyna_25__2027@NODE_208_length_4405_cov_20_746221_g162_i0_p1_GENE_NODE_208_length_4405_cov_20_746221_g162_i0NODE_208_length_4405_cov_20_746221_g162_i0_p1_ORF_typecomplete_len806_score142_73ANAPC4_WD40/PF12894_7/0_00069ANAPC4_WD40/PF12894_7/0_1ANAPC4_WD40/PF12894_7/0_7PQQ_2/PF13360_6/2_4e05PQQ_2/PF13360_6/6_4e02Frtz/PF11768_8/0_19Frtz/PF11768_8/9_5Frtz/PF11768_8/3_4e02WD40_like/PF17005_5/0_0041Cytochrom_D1/PF02239_16/28Cytochrom_D1/PF02239_16/0_41WD40/PF00400_32/0_3WD40/PF0040